MYCHLCLYCSSHAAFDWFYMSYTNFYRIPVDSYCSDLTLYEKHTHAHTHTHAGIYSLISSAVVVNCNWLRTWAPAPQELHVLYLFKLSFSTHFGLLIVFSLNFVFLMSENLCNSAMTGPALRIKIRLGWTKCLSQYFKFSLIYKKQCTPEILLLSTDNSS